MKKTVKIFRILKKENLGHVCRCCLSQDALNQNIFELVHDNVVFVEIFSTLLCTSVNTGDEMPKNICEGCLKEVIRFYNFKKNFDKVGRILSTIITKNRTKPPEAPPPPASSDSPPNPPTSAQPFDPHSVTIKEEIIDIDYGENEIKTENCNTEGDVPLEPAQIKSENDREAQQAPTLESPESSEEPPPESPDSDYHPPESPDSSEEPPPEYPESSEESPPARRPPNVSNNPKVPCKVFTCSCHQTFTSLVKLHIHKKEQNHNGPPRYMCKICDKSFSRSGFRMHKYLHSDEKQFQCKFCGKRFTLQCTLHRHELIHTGERRHVCEFCGKGFIRAVGLREHHRIHTGEKPYLCEHCGENFRTEIGYNVHRKKHEEPEEINQKCDICNKEYCNKYYLQLHLMKHAWNSHSCNICKKSFYYRKSLQMHYYKQHFCTQLQCAECEMQFASPLRYCVHFEHVHGEGRTLKDHEKLDKDSHQCEFCKKVFSKREILDNHMLIHSMLKKSNGRHVLNNNKRLTCTVCEKTFSNSSYLKTHMAIHTGHKPFVCTICSKSFVQKGHLKVHFRTHSGEKPYKCTYCEKSFPHSGTLTQHLRTHTGERPYGCDQCSMTFCHMSTLRQHQARHKRKSMAGGGKSKK